MRDNKTCTILTLIFFFLTGCATNMNKNPIKFSWDASESAPLHYPMEIIKGTFIYKGESTTGLYIPDGGTIMDGWGDAISSHVTGERFKPLPDKLSITFFSYAEKQFYRGDFDLPYETILRLFREGVLEGELGPTYSTIVAGIAPGGVVAVWITGQKRKEIFFGQAEKVELNPSAAFALPFDSKEESDLYIQKVFEADLTQEELESLKKNGIPFGLWKRYRNLYRWAPIFINGEKLASVSVSYVNGEFDRKAVFEDPQAISAFRPVPNFFSFKTSQYIYKVNFNEMEMIDAFERLGANNTPVLMEFDPRYPRSSSKVRLYNDEESIELKKAIFKDW
jgi:hypothetical protein